MGKMRMAVIVLSVMGIVGVTGCGDSDAEKESAFLSGYRRGLEEGQKSGYAEGFDAGFQQAAPGGNPRLKGTFGIAKQAMVVGGALKLLLLLSAAIAYLIRDGHDRKQQMIGKVLCIFLGAFIVIWIADILGYSSVINRIMLSPTPSVVWVGLLWSAGAAALIYALLSGFHNLFIRKLQELRVQAFCIFVLSAFWTVLAPALATFVIGTPHTNRYLASDILIGILLGGILFLIKILLSEDETRAAPRRRRSFMAREDVGVPAAR